MHPMPRVVVPAPAGWGVLQRWLRCSISAGSARHPDPVKQVAANLFEHSGRIWLLAGVIVLSALLGGRSDGLTASS